MFTRRHRSIVPAQHTGWSCPVCATPVPHPYRPGRARVYCTNSCRQRAYRWRRRHRSELAAPRPPERASTRGRTHAMRARDDLVMSQTLNSAREPMVRRVTACGAFARAALDTPARWAHTKFFAAASHDDAGTVTAGTCRSCTALLSVPIESMGDIHRRLGVGYSGNPGTPSSS